MNTDVAVTRDGSAIASRILTIRGVQVILDWDIAELYGVETRVLNQAVKRNAARFPERFRFLLSKSELSELITSCDKFGNKKHYPGTPAAFTEQGVAMLSAVLRSQTAVDVSIRIMDAFVAMRHFIVTNSAVLQRLGAVEMKQIAMDEKLNTVLGKIESKEFPPEKIFYDGHEYDAYEKVVEFIRKAKMEIVIIDPYADNVVLQILAKKRANASVVVVKGPRARLSALDETKYNQQFANSLTVKTSTVFHDRFIILDQSILLHVGASLNHLGKRCFAFSAMDASNIPDIMAKIP